MQIHRYFIEKSLDNFNHLLIDEASKQAIVVDPFSAATTNYELEHLGLSLSGILITHGHHDHVKGVIELKAKHQVPVYGHAATPNTEIDIAIADGDDFSLFDTPIKVLQTDGHFPNHLCFYFPTLNAFISGDTLFNAGVGHVRNGDVKALHKSVERLLSYLPANTKLYSGHNYLVHNCRFTLSIDATNKEAQNLIAQNIDKAPNQVQVTTIEQEKKINLFMQAILNPSKFAPKLGAHSQEIFIQLRTLRDQW